LSSCISQSNPNIASRIVIPVAGKKNGKNTDECCVPSPPAPPQGSPLLWRWWEGTQCQAPDLLFQLVSSSPPGKALLGKILPLNPKFPQPIFASNSLEEIDAERLNSKSFTIIKEIFLVAALDAQG